MGHDAPITAHNEVKVQVDAAIVAASYEIADWLFTPTEHRKITRDGVASEVEAIIRRHAYYGDKPTKPAHELPDQIDWNRARALANG